MFNGAYELREITVDEGNSKFKAIDGILYNKGVTEIVHVPHNNKISSLKLPATNN